MHTDYVNPAIRQLRDQQVRFAPREKKIEQVNRAEKLLGELEAARTYTYEYLCYRITNYRPESYPSLKLSGGEASHDLQLFVEDLSDAANISAEAAGERVLTVDELSRQFQVSTKTISRWRRQGLVSRRFVFDGRKRVGFLESSVERFVRKNTERVRRGAHFSQLTQRERQRIIDRARRLARAGGCPAEVTQAFGPRHRPQCGDHPLHAQAVRPRSSRAGDLPGQHRSVARRDEAEDLPAVPPRRGGRGAGQEVLPHEDQHLPRDRRDACPSDLGIAVGLHSQRGVCRNPRRASASARCSVRFRPATRRLKRGRLPSGLPPYLASLYEVPLLSREQEGHLFRKMNYLKYKASELRKELDPSRPKSSLMDQIERLYEESGGRQESDHLGQLAAGGLDRQAARRSGGELFRAGQRRQHVADPGGRRSSTTRGATSSAPTRAGPS